MNDMRLLLGYPSLKNPWSRLVALATTWIRTSGDTFYMKSMVGTNVVISHGDTSPSVNRNC